MRVTYSLVRLVLAGSSPIFGVGFGGAAPPLGVKNDRISGILEMAVRN